MTERAQEGVGMGQAQDLKRIKHAEQQDSSMLLRYCTMVQ